MYSMSNGHFTGPCWRPVVRIWSCCWGFSLWKSELRMTHWTLGETNREQLTEKVSILILYIPSRLERQIILFYCKLRKHRERGDRTKQQKWEPMISYSKNRETGLKQKPICLVLTQRKRQENWGHRHSGRRTWGKSFLPLTAQAVWKLAPSNRY